MENLHSSTIITLLKYLHFSNNISSPDGIPIRLHDYSSLWLKASPPHGMHQGYTGESQFKLPATFVLYCNLKEHTSRQRCGQL
ncbi:hypothetical protein GDO81_014497 [Engystomops pustulosus]|uniref:Uncharacterized protein n=1 Tax=Engystomops pustulosus TaxID=76066 RepID=A0AAV7BAQ4_ENGPU|nr:hypothetical protein GDO81_014497 [Engystomops pustulosus]